MVARGQIWWADFGVPLGSEPGFVRPAVVVSSDRFNRSRIRTVIVAPVSSNLRQESIAGSVRLPDDLLAKPSVVITVQAKVVDRSRLIKYVVDLPARARFQLDEGLRLVLDL